MAKISLAGLQQFVVGFEDETFHVGIDVHKRSYHIALHRCDGRALSLVSPASPQAIIELLTGLNIRVGAVAYESGPTGFSLARMLFAAGFPVIVAAPSKIPRSVTPGAKCDRLDCLKLANYAAKGMLKSIAIPTQQEEARRTLLRRRHMLVDDVRRCKQRIKGLLLFLGVDEPKELEHWQIGVDAVLLALPIDSAAHMTLQSYLRELTFNQEELRRIEHQLKSLTKTEELANTMTCLQSIPGVGPVVATTFAMELFRPERFKRPEEVASYLGLAPVVRQSGNKSSSGRLVPAGQTRLRSLLIEAAWMWRSRDSYAENLYRRLLGKTGIAQKAIAVVARRLAIILWRLYVEQRPYRIVIS
ncbi:transposase IS116/IS110/IS902 family protein [Geobacter metallireducens RCH3]|uniref:Transposase, IS110 family n=1 Tax=Geobacter metallireducens (strain ATCC 53774 / DSM 7210 / GS-15) TaxID=269799 RepID=Q39SJ0_GEOMG|nr:IS110 family transposase [Geobacter metallireducens]ABB32784.1 transposase, IS110 family [Geobacter metallireducens GS-15]EHP86106.1 transposase IS116/IS110/IS902 family protein [Geobacter metallireducens RCH3]